MYFTVCDDHTIPSKAKHKLIDKALLDLEDSNLRITAKREEIQKIQQQIQELKEKRTEQFGNGMRNLCCF